METRKQGLLRRHRRNKRITMAVALPIMVALDWFAGWSSLPVLLLLAWIAHEAWFSDHLFYSPRDDYQYSFPASSQVATGTLSKGRIALDTVDLTNAMDTLILEVSIHSSWLGRWLDPHILICAEAILDRQDFEQGARGRRYLNISGLLPELQSGKLRLRTRFCRLSTEVRLYAFSNPDYAMRRVMVIAPHADDAELAAFTNLTAARP